MNELIKIEERNGEQLVSARELHQFLEVKTEFKVWISRISEKYCFVENKDFVRVYQKCNTLGGEQEKVDYLLKISMAKEVAMVSNTTNGKQARGYFIKCEEAWNSPQMILARANQIQSRMLENYKEKVLVLEQKIEEDKPKVLFAEAVETSKSCILIGELAKILKQNGIDTGQKRMFTWLRGNGYLIKRQGTDYNMPTQKAMELALFEIKETAITHSDGHISVNKTVKVTGKGQIYFVNLFKKLKEVV